MINFIRIRKEENLEKKKTKHQTLDIRQLVNKELSSWTFIFLFIIFMNDYSFMTEISVNGKKIPPFI